MHTLPHGNKNPRKAIKGITLIELVVWMSILSICAVLTTGSIVGTYAVINSVSQVKGVYEEGVNVLKRLGAEMQDANSVTIVGETGIRIVKTHAGSDGYTQVFFYKDGSVLYRQGEPAGTARVLVQNVTGFEVSNDEVSSNIYTLRLTMQDADGTQHQLRADVYPMNLQGVSAKNFYNTSTSAGDWASVISNY